jgi:uncharacterized protein
VPNRLAQANSPYLLQHAHNPVDWYPWGNEALEKARTEDKPIFLSIGYAACHWCHVMAHESFEEPTTAALMNENFVNIKVDREERPDLDTIYMNAVVSMTGQGGWPMSVFLTPEGEPFFGGTYFPPVRRYNMPAFQEILQTIARLWREDRARILESSQQITQQLKSNTLPGAAHKPLSPGVSEQAALQLAQNYNWKFGGWGGKPRFPAHMVLDFLLRRAALDDSLALDMVTHNLDAMARGGMYDIVGGGFARYSTDDMWLVPHFEKMLYDNAQLALVYLHAFLLSGDLHYRRVCEETLDFITRELSDPKGGFYSSLDADSEGSEGKFYVWEPAEIRTVLGKAQESHDKSGLDWVAFFSSAYAVPAQGNFEGKVILQRTTSDAELAEKFGLTENEVLHLLAEMSRALLQARSKRVRPGLDDKVLAAWNGLALSAFAEAGRYLQRNDYTETARRNAAFLLQELHPGERMLRSWRNGEAQHNGYLEDYAAVILGLLALYQTDPDPAWFSAASRLSQEMREHFTDPQGGFFDTRDDHGPLLLRPKDLQDNATPCGNSLAACALLQLALYRNDDEMRQQAEAMLGEIQETAIRYPTAFGFWLCAIDFALAAVLEIAILAPTSSAEALPLTSKLWSTYRPHALAAISAFPPATGSPELLADRPLLEGKPSAYVCKHFVCQRPVTSPDEFETLLESNYN